MCIIGYDSLGNTAEFLLLEDYYLNPQIKIDDQHTELSGTDDNSEQMQEFTSEPTRPIDASRATCAKEDTRYTPQYTFSGRIKIPISCYSNNPIESQSFTCSSCGSTCQKNFSRDSNYEAPHGITSERVK